MTILFAPSIVTPSRAASRQITIRDPGGVYNRAFEEVFYKPFTQATGIQVISAASKPEPTAEIRTMVETKHYLWDIAVLSNRAALYLTTGNIYLEQHALGYDPLISAIPPQFRSPYHVGAYIYSAALAYRTDIFKGYQVPDSWKDLWDVDHFPGRRSLFRYPFDTIEIALMADGVPPSKVYPCDLNRAFRSLDKIKPHVAVWWTSAPQTEQLLSFNEVDLLQIYTDRAQSVMNKGIPVALSWNQHIYKAGSWTILKGTPNADLCRQFIKFAVDPKRQALLAAYGIAPTHPDAFNYIDAKHAKLLPTYPDNLKKGLLTNNSYWLKNKDAIIERFNEWRLA